ncbi:MAG TPA: type II toxin-antitoxin system RelB/DinJ family antitoxin [Bacteroidota bacterium]|nr:type II toxin-antitoxin system RelB/DinJ family antitoxin [Bacteroidota bacterium]
MKTALIHVKTDPEIKKEAQEVANLLGLSLSSILNAYLRQFIRTKTLHLSLRKDVEEYTPLYERIADAEANFQKDNVIVFDHPSDAVAYLRKKVGKNENRLRKNVR